LKINSIKRITSEEKKIKPALTVFTMFVIFAVSTLLIISPPVHAYTNGIAYYGDSLTCGSFGGSTTIQGDLLVIEVADYTGATITSITDASGDIWAKATSSATSSWTTEIWYSNAVSTSTGAITISYSTTPTYCWTEFLDFNTFSSFLNIGTTTGYTYSCYTLCPVVNINKYVLLPPLNIPPASIVVSVGATYSTELTGAGGCFSPTITGQLPLTYITKAQGIFSNTINGWMGYYYTVGGNSSFRNTYEENICAGEPANNGLYGTYIGTYAIAVFSTNGLSPQPQSITGVTGGNGLSSSSYSLKSNETIFYPAETGQGTLVLSNLTTRIKSISTDGGNANITLSVYELPSVYYTLYPITTANAFQRVFFYTWNLPNNANAQTLWVIPNIAITNGSSYAIGLSTDRKGIDVFGTTNSITLDNDTVDGYNPKLITTYSNSTNPLYLTASWYIIPPETNNTVDVYTTYTCPTGSTCTETGSTTTYTFDTTITNLASPTGGVLILTDMITYLPIWFFPLLFGKLLGTTGLLYGLMLALILGIFMGLFPYWTIFLIIIMIYLLLR
jgi:hypothetical protein